MVQRAEIMFKKIRSFIGPRTRWHYWSCSKFADRIRGTEKPLGLTLDEWKQWKIDSENKHPFRYWLAEEFLTIVQNALYFPYDFYSAIKHYYTNRFVDKTHYLKTGLTPGKYYDLDYRIIHGLFNELKNYVEIELAHLMKCYEDRNYKFVNGRCPKAGLDYIDWSMSLTYGPDYGYEPTDKLYNKPTPQAESAKEILELYNWWNNRDNRPDPHVESGWDKFYESKNSKEKEKSFKKLQKIEDNYEKEDENMLIKLIKVRKSLWT